MTRLFYTPMLCVVLISGCVSSNEETQHAVITHTKPAFETAPCSTGIYRADTDNFVVITEADTGYKYSFDTGITGNIDLSDQTVRCGTHSVLVDNRGVWRKVTLREIDTQFQSHGVKLAGRLIEPRDASANTPLVVYAHGSESSGWINRARDPYQMVGRGISVFVYDKRGGGLSKGKYTQNFPLLSDDLVAASAEAKRLAKGRFGRFGLFGLSQGGWIAPLAAERAKAEFIGIGYGLVVDIREEDAAQVEKELRDAGYGDEVIRKAKEITDATAQIAASNYTKSLEEMEAARNRYKNEPWFRLIKASYTGVYLSMSVDDLRENGVPQFNDLDIDWNLDPVKVVGSVNVPQLWILAGEDREAPIDQTLNRLKNLRQKGSDIAISIFPETDHGMWEYSENSDGSRTYSKVTTGFYDLMADWAKGTMGTQYGRARSE